MRTENSNNTPDNTYFNTSDVEPKILSDGTVRLYDGQGSRRGWGTPGVTSTIILDQDDFIAVHVGFHHKHGGGQFWRYFTTDGTSTRRLTWAQLPDEQRVTILAAARAKAPAWAKAPGKLRSQYTRPVTRTQISYKLVEQTEAGALVSLYDGATEYQIGKRLAEAVGQEAGAVDLSGYGDYRVTHAGGFYSHPTADQVLALLNRGALLPARIDLSAKTLVLLECEISGRIVTFPNGKLASTYLKPTRIVQTSTPHPGGDLTAWTI